jgi:hypothetical protein
MYLLDLKAVDKVAYRREISSVQAKVGHDELAKIQSGSVLSDRTSSIFGVGE